MKMRFLEKLLINNRLREYILRKYEAPRVLSNLPLLNGKECLEIGSGNGAGALLIRRFTGCKKIVSIDIDPFMIQEANRLINKPPSWARSIPSADIEFKVCDAARMDFDSESFDAAFHFFVFDHIPEWKTALKEVYRVLKPGAVYSFEEAIIPEKSFLFNRYFGHVSFTAEELSAGIEAAGFKIDQFSRGKYFPRCFVRAGKAITWKGEQKEGKCK
jgi:ubiquinone/menaquinone biosynthesis C-methylase UbiE